MKIVKYSITHIIAFILMIILTTLSVFLALENNLCLNKLDKNMNQINYYNQAYNNIQTKINDFIILDEIQRLYNEYLTKEMVENDIKEVTKSIYEKREYKLNRYDDFYKIIYEYSEDKEISTRYASEINKIYQDNLFPVMPFKLLNKLYLNNNKQIIIVVSLIILSLFSIYLLHLMTSNYKFVTISILGMSILIILPNIFIKAFKIFNNFLYANEYFTKIILLVVDNTLNTLFIIGIILIVFMVIMKLKKKIFKNL